MKKAISIIVVLLVLVLIIVSVSKKPVPENTASVSTSTASAIALNNPSIADGMYMVNPSDVAITWTGRKVILKDWIDVGNVSLKEGWFEVKNNTVVSNEFTIDMNSIMNKENGMKKNQDMLTKHLKSADFFDVEKFPTSKFVAKSIVSDMGTSTATSTLKLNVVGDLTIKDVTKEITIPVTFSTLPGGILSVKGSVDLDRTEWNVVYGSGKFFKNLGDNVIDDMFNISFDLKTKAASSTPVVTPVATTTVSVTATSTATSTVR